MIAVHVWNQRTGALRETFFDEPNALASRREGAREWGVIRDGRPDASRVFTDTDHVFINPPCEVRRILAGITPEFAEDLPARDARAVVAAMAPVVRDLAARGRRVLGARPASASGGAAPEPDIPGGALDLLVVIRNDEDSTLGRW